MVFRNTTHMGSDFVVRTQTTILVHQRLGLRWMIDAWENTLLFSETEPKPGRQVQEHKTISLDNNTRSSVAYYPKNSHVHKQNIRHFWWLHLLRIKKRPKSWKTKSVRPNRLHMFVKALDSITFDDFAGASNIELGPTFSGGSFLVDFRKKLMCARERWLLRKCVNWGTYKPMTPIRRPTRTTNSIGLVTNFC